MLTEIQQVICQGFIEVALTTPIFFQQVDQIVSALGFELQDQGHIRL